MQVESESRQMVRSQTKRWLFQDFTPPLHCPARRSRAQCWTVDFLPRAPRYLSLLSHSQDCIYIAFAMHIPNAHVMREYPNAT